MGGPAGPGVHVLSSVLCLEIKAVVMILSFTHFLKHNSVVLNTTIESLVQYKWIFGPEHTSDEVQDQI